MGKFSAFKLPLKSLGTGTHNFEYHLDKQFFTNMENSDIHGADLDVKLTVVYNGEFYTLDFSIAGEVTLICDRCLDDLHFPIEATYHIVVKYGEDYNDDNDEVLEIPLKRRFPECGIYDLRHSRSRHSHQARSSAGQMQPSDERDAEKTPGHHRRRRFRTRRPAHRRDGFDG